MTQEIGHDTSGPYIRVTRSDCGEIPLDVEGPDGLLWTLSQVEVAAIRTGWWPFHRLEVLVIHTYRPEPFWEATE